MSSLRAKIVRLTSGAFFKRIELTKLDVKKLRRQISRLSALMLPAFGVQIDVDQLNGLHVEWLTPKNSMDGKLLLYLHGGGYIVGGCDMHRQMVSHIARAGRIRTLLPEYRLAPEHRFPAALDDAVSTYRSLLDMGIRPEDIIIGGDSAGGGLTVGLLLTLRDAGDPLPAAAVLLSPFLDATGSGDSMQTRKDRDPLFYPEGLSFIVDQYCDPHQRRFPQISPVFADVEGLPPMLIQVGDDEILLSDSERLAEKCVAAGIDVELQIWPQMWHVFQMFVGKMPEAKKAIKQMGTYIQSQF
jgi:acetyl esterase/lipase